MATAITKVEKLDANTNVSESLHNEVELESVKWLLDEGVTEEMIFGDSQSDWYIKLSDVLNR
jgi:hypothetical protein